MKIEKLREKIENNGLKEAKGFEELFETNVHDLFKACKKSNLKLVLNSIAYVGKKEKINKDIMQHVCVVYSLTDTKKSQNIACSTFVIKESELEDFMELAQQKSITSLVKINLADPTPVKAEFFDHQKINFKTICIKADGEKNEAIKMFPNLNDCLWKIVEENFDKKLKMEQTKVVKQIEQNKKILTDLKNRKKELKVKNTEKDLNLVFGDKK